MKNVIAVPCRRSPSRFARRVVCPESFLPRTAVAGRSFTTTRTQNSANSSCTAPRRVWPQSSRSCLRPVCRSALGSQAGQRYHSHDRPPPPGPFSTAERDLLSAAYAHVPAHGFSHASLALGARDAGYPEISSSLLPDGVFSLVRWHLVTQREALAGRAADLFGEGSSPDALGIGRKIEALTWERLMGNKPVIGRWQEALAIMAQPTYVPESLKELARLSDEIWFLSGDASVDPSWYTQRASLSTIYASTELFMTTDNSENFIETSKFLRRRLGEVQNVGGVLRAAGEWAGFTASAGLNLLRSKGARI